MHEQAEVLRDLVVAHQNFLKASRAFREVTGLHDMDAIQIEMLTEFCREADPDQVDAKQFENLFKVLK